jgi:transposase
MPREKKQLVFTGAEIQTGLNPQDKLAHRQEGIKPDFYAFKEWVETQHKNVMSKEGIVKALHYSVNQLPMIDPLFKDGRINIDNNEIENKIKTLALERKNFLFAGSKEEVKRIAIVYSLFASNNKIHDNPYACKTNTLSRNGNHPVNKLAELLSNNLKKF